MQDSTTIKVSVRTRDELRQFAGSDTLEAGLRRLLREARQRRMGAELAAYELTSDDEAWVNLGLVCAAEELDRPVGVHASR